MSTRPYRLCRLACHSTYPTMASVFVLPPMLFTTFRKAYDVSFTLLGTLIVINFFVQMAIDLVFTFFSHRFNLRTTIRICPLFTTVGLLIFGLVPALFPQWAYPGLALGTVIFSIAAGLSEVLISPLVAAIPSEHPEREMSLLHSLYGWGVVGIVLIASLYFSLFGTENWLYLVLICAVLPLISSALFFSAEFPEFSVVSKMEKKQSKERNFRVFLCAVCIFLGGSAETVMTNWISGYLEISLNIPKDVGDLLGLALFAFLLATTRILYAKYSPDITKILLGGMIGAFFCYLTAGLCPNIPLSILACILTGVFTSLLWPGTLIMMEEHVPFPTVASYALMAACGDFGGALSPQLLGIVADRIAKSGLTLENGLFSNLNPEQLGLKIGMIVACIFPFCGILLLLFIRRRFSADKK